MIYRLLAILLTLLIFGSGTAIAGFGKSQGPPDSGHLDDLLGVSDEKLQAYAASDPAGSQALQPVEDSKPRYIYYDGLYLTRDEFTEAFSGKSPSLWVQSPIGWSWYSTLTLGQKTKGLLYLPRGGSLKSYEIYPSGIIQVNDLGWVRLGYGYFQFEGDTPGRHILLLTINDLPSNSVVIDVSEPDDLY